MLQSIRERAQGVVAWIILVMLGVAFAFWGIGRFIGEWESNSAQTVAKVNGTEITTSQFDVMYQRLKRQMELQSGSDFVITNQIEAQLKQRALSNLITNTLLTQAALSQGFSVTDEQVDSVLSSIPEFQVNGKFSTDRFQQVLNALLYSQSDFLNQLKSDMILNQAELGIISSGFALSSDVDNAYRLLNQTRDFSYLIVPKNKFANQINISEQQEQNYYSQNQNQFQTPEQVSISYVELSLPALQSKLKFSDDEVQEYYQSNLENFTQPAQWQVAQILINLPANANAGAVAEAQKKITLVQDKLKAGDSFDDVVKEYSEDALSANKAGVLPWVSAGAMGAAFDQAMAQLKPGQISQAIRTPYGIAIFKLIAIQPSKVHAFADVKTQVMNMLAADRAAKEFAEDSQKLSDLTYSNSNSLDTAAKQLNLTIQSTPLFSKEGSKTGITSNSKVISAAFSNSLLNEGNNSDVIQIDPNTQIVLRIQKHVAAAVKPFAQVQAEIKNILIASAEAAKAKDLAANIVTQLNSGKNIQIISKAQNLHWNDVVKASRHDQKINVLILDKAFDLPRPNNSAIFASIDLPSGDSAIVMLKQIHDADVNIMSSEDKIAFQQKLANDFGHLDYELYVARHMQLAKIKVDKKNEANDVGM